MLSIRFLVIQLTCVISIASIFCTFGNLFFENFSRTGAMIACSMGLIAGELIHMWIVKPFRSKKKIYLVVEEEDNIIGMALSAEDALAMVSKYYGDELQWMSKFKHIKEDGVEWRLKVELEDEAGKKQEYTVWCNYFIEGEV